MKLFGISIGKKQEKRNEQPQQQPITFGEALTFGGLYNGYAAMNVSAVYRAVELISDSIASLPIYITSRTDKELTGHNLNYIFKNMVMNRYTFMKMLVQSILLKGNGYAYILRGDDGTVTDIQFLEAGDVQINWDKFTRTLYYTINVISGKTRKVEPCNIIHLLKNSYDGIHGLSVLSYATRAVKLANNTENSANSFFTSGCNLAGVLTVQGQLSDKQRADIRSAWSQAYSNGGNGLAVLQGNMEYKPIQLSAADSQLLESRQYNVQDIARFFGISPVLLGDLTYSSYNTLEAAQNEFLLHTLNPYITLIEEEFTRKLFKPSEQGMKVRLDENAIMKTDKAAQADYYGKLIEKGVLSVNEVRGELGYSEIEGGDKHFVAFTDIQQNTIEE